MLLNSFINHSVITLKVVEEQVEEEEEDGEMVAVELKLSPRHSVSQSVTSSLAFLLISGKRISNQYLDSWKSTKGKVFANKQTNKTSKQNTILCVHK